MKEHLKSSIREARIDRRMSQADFAQAVGVSIQSVGKWESGRGVPELDRLEVIGEVLGKSPSWLLGFSQEHDDMVLVPRHYAALLRDILTQKGLPVPTELTSFQPPNACPIVCNDSTQEDMLTVGSSHQDPSLSPVISSDLCFLSDWTL